MDTTLQQQHSVSPPIGEAANLTANAGDIVNSPSTAPPKEEAKTPSRKKAKTSEAFMKEQAERQEEQEQQEISKEEVRESFSNNSNSTDVSRRKREKQL